QGAGTAAQNLAFSANVSSAGSLAATTDISLVSNPLAGTGLTGQTTHDTTHGTTTGGGFDYPAAQDTRNKLAFGNVHTGASVSSQGVAFGNQTITSASFQDLLNVSATTGNAKVTATGFSNLAASTGGASMQSLTFSVNTSSAGSLASTA